ncbi:MAG: hypothetical protein M1838_002401 [Thelocarpon superellum]|nr:MAG: hypothetical protein M1838_002401 [Thelocarpon superellum]
MTELAGVMVGGIALGTLFTECVDCFEHVQLGQTIGPNYRRGILRLDIARLRFTRWGQSVHINDIPGAGLRQHHVVVATREEQGLVRDLLGQILVIFTETRQLSETFRVSARPKDLAVVDANTALEPGVKALHHTMRVLSLQRQKRASPAPRTKWALYEEKHLDDLIDQVGTRVDRLINLFPAAQGLQRTECEREVATMDCHALRALDGVVKDDKLLQEVLDQDVQRAQSTYKSVKAFDYATMQLGEQVNDGSITNNRDYHFEDLSAAGRSVIQAGATLGGMSIFELQRRTPVVVAAPATI